ncbi:hypothetical protein C8R44DRAFT_749027 [Mycena epipterygia]|nr:hypothetical protein C8R44DRAFT_749027 [Mycena epipterygia]
MSASGKTKPLLTGKRTPRAKRAKEAEARYLGAVQSKVRGFIANFMLTWWIKFLWYKFADRPGVPVTMVHLDLNGLLALAGTDLKSDTDVPEDSWGDTAILDSTASVEEDVPGNDEHDWKATGGVDPALKGAIQLDVTEALVLTPENQGEPEQQQPIWGMAEGLSMTSESTEGGSAQVLYAAGGFCRHYLDHKKSLAFCCQLAQELLDAEDKEIVLHAGRTHVTHGGQGIKFDQWDMEDFKKNIMGQFMRFLLEPKPHSSLGASHLPKNSGGVSAVASVAGTTSIPANADVSRNTVTPDTTTTLPDSSPAQNPAGNNKAKKGKRRGRGRTAPPQ